MISGCVRIPGKINIYQSEMFSGIQSNFLLIAPTAVFFSGDDRGGGGG